MKALAGPEAEKGVPSSEVERRRILLASAVLVSLIALVFGRSLTVPFLFDDIDAIVDNPNIRRLWPLSVPLSWPATLPATTGRPLVSLTLALNYAVHGLDVRGYHLVSLALHAASALLLLGILKRTLQTPRLRERFGDRALPIAAVVAAIWAVHPLQTEAVTYVIVRTELLVSFFYLLTLYASIRAWGSARPGRWETVAVAACALGMASKEIMVSAPLMVVVYDHVFLREGSGLPRHRRRLYAGLAASWVVLGGLLATGAMIRAAVQKDWGPFQNLWMQSKVLAHYLRLVFWPHPLVITYDWPGPTGFLRALPFVLALGTAFIASAWAAWRRRPIGFLGLWFFLILAPTSSFLPLPTEVASERRMYLPLAAVLALVVVGASRRIRGRFAALGILLPLLAVLGLVSASRIRDYETALSIWRDATAKSPNSMLARNQYSRALLEAGRVDEALEQSLESLRVAPDRNPIAHQNAGYLLVVKQKPTEALQHLEESVRLQPNRAKAQFVLGRALANLGRSREAAEHYRRALELEPGVEACGALAMSLARATAIQDGVAQMEECLRRWPQDPRLRNNLASLLIQDNRHAEALAQFAESVRLDPSYALGRFNMSLALLHAGRVEDGVRELVRAYRDAGADEGLRRRILARARALAGPAQSALRESVRYSQDPALSVLIEP